MKRFTIKQNSYLDRDIKGFYNCDYIGYQQKGNPDFINKLKNTTKSHNEMDLVQEFLEVAERATKDLRTILDTENLNDPIITIIPRSKAENNYKQSQLMFKKAISSVVDKIEATNGSNAIKRIKDTKTTHNWRLKNNTGDTLYKGITKDTCEIDKRAIHEKDVILVDDIYTKDVNVAEDCIQTLFDFGAKNVILYVVAKTRS